MWPRACSKPWSTPVAKGPPYVVPPPFPRAESMTSIILKLAAKQFNLNVLNDASTVVVLTCVSGLSLYILIKFIAGCRRELAYKAAKG